MNRRRKNRLYLRRLYIFVAMKETVQAIFKATAVAVFERMS